MTATQPTSHPSTPGLTPAAGQDGGEDSIDRLIREESERFLARQPRSAELIERSRRHLAGGATSNWQIADPQAVWMSHGAGSRIFDVDGTEYSDFHGGYGVSLAGHAHPAIVRAVTERVGRGTHFAQPTEDSIVVAEELARRWGLPQWRFGNSGTESTMDAVHLMRVATGRDRLLKVEGCYHGHHDSVQVSVAPEEGEMGPADAPTSAPAGSGVPQAMVDLVTIVPFNDLAAVDRALAAHPGSVAGMILEPLMMNAGVIHPQPGYLAGLKELLHAHGALLTFDEVKTGLTVGPGGVTRAQGVTPDIVCIAKAIGGGVSTAAIGGTEELMALIADGTYEQVGTFNGNPLAMAATRAMLTEVMTDAAYAHIERLASAMRAGIEEIIERHDLPWHVVTAGAKGCIAFRSEAIRNYRDFLDVDERLGQAHWLVQHNGGVFLPPWGKIEQWLISVQHNDEDVERFVTNVDRLARAVRAA
ncbi:aspartate aminotransferase family protein [Nocardioides sp.]|uniref:aspartate aminotransferase family protein n=1 Tax=Nocardioides sp. TaxID=35761 RepID=UPI002ED1CBA4